MSPNNLPSSISDLFAPYDQPEIEILILIPNGLITKLTVSGETRLYEIKEEVFELASDLPMFGALYDKETYVFTCVNFTTGEQEEIDENRSLADVKPFMQILRLIERKGDIASKQLNAQIGPLIGKGLHEFDALKNPEINDFRWRVRHLVEEISEERYKRPWHEKVNYKYTVRVERTNDLPTYLKDRLVSNEIEIEVRLKSSEEARIFIIPYSCHCDEVIKTALTSFDLNDEDSEQYVLKVCGLEEFLMDNHELIRYKYVREALADYSRPSFIIISKNTIDVNETFRVSRSDFEFRSRSSTMMSISSNQQTTTRRKAKPISSFSVTDKLSITINDCIKLNHSDDVRIAVAIGLFHGGTALTHSVSTSDAHAENGVVTWNETLTFDIAVADLPRMTRLCLVVYEIMVRCRKGSRGVFFRANIACDITSNPLKWANTPLFDYKGQLKVGRTSLPMWSYPESQISDPDDPDHFNPLGTVLPNPSSDDGTALIVTFPRGYPTMASPDSAIFYPTYDAILRVTCRSSLTDTRKSGDHTPSSRYLSQLRTICTRDPLTDMASKDRELLWYFREDLAIHLPSSLPHLLSCVTWSCHDSVCSMLQLLTRWPLIQPEVALQLLDYAYADCHVRHYALQCLKSMSDDDLSLYLLQLVQALKYESYLYCDLALFLLEKSLRNRRLGHQFFWLLRSEMADNSVSVYFGLLLEAYCRGSVDHMRELSKQMEAVNKLRHMNEIVKREAINRKESKERLLMVMREILEQSYYAETLKELTNPLDPRIRLKNVIIDKCKCMDSKMKPLWLVFANSDCSADDVP